MSRKKIYILDEETIENIEMSLYVNLYANRKTYYMLKWSNWNSMTNIDRIIWTGQWISDIRKDMYALHKFNRIFHPKRDC